MTKHRGGGRRNYPRTARLKELFREILAEELERIDDPDLDLLTVIDVEVDNDLHHATLFFAAPHDPDDPEAAVRDAEVREALGRHRVRLQSAIGRQARVKRVPELAFAADEVTRGAARIEEILRELPELQDDHDDAGESAGDDVDGTGPAVGDGLDPSEGPDDSGT